MTAHSALLVSVIIPTFRRPAMLRDAVASVLAQTALTGARGELLVVDNNPDGSERPFVESLGATQAIPVRYVHARDPGLANARNAGVRAAQAPYLAFLDDDETAAPDWLDGLLSVADQFGADVVFGPVHAVVPDDLPHAEMLRRFFSRFGPADAGVTATYYGTGNSLIRRAALPNAVSPFDAARNFSGGEDNLLFHAMHTAGARMAWAPDALVQEHPPLARLRLDYVLRRAFTFGQGTTWEAVALGPRGWPMVLVWMAWGAWQFCLYGVLALVARPENRAERLRQSSQGLGKCLWFGPFRIHHYGGDADAG